MTEAETTQAVKALQAWFISQDISPADAGVCMVTLMAKLMVDQSRDLNRLASGIGLFTKLLAIEVAQACK